MLEHCYAECDLFLTVTYAECHYAECRYADCHYADCHYADCRGARMLIISSRLLKFDQHLL
jgi:hypothetical protein